jgi:hypothetical protein
VISCVSAVVHLTGEGEVFRLLLPFTRFPRHGRHCRRFDDQGGSGRPRQNDDRGVSAVSSAAENCARCVEVDAGDEVAWMSGRAAEG